jgi:hypothetical protein
MNRHISSPPQEPPNVPVIGTGFSEDGPQHRIIFPADKTIPGFELDFWPARSGVGDREKHFVVIKVNCEQSKQSENVTTQKFLAILQNKNYSATKDFTNIEKPYPGEFILVSSMNPEFNSADSLFDGVVALFEEIKAKIENQLKELNPKITANLNGPLSSIISQTLIESIDKTLLSLQIKSTDEGLTLFDATTFAETIQKPKLANTLSELSQIQIKALSDKLIVSINQILELYNCKIKANLSNLSIEQTHEVINACSDASFGNLTGFFLGISENRDVFISNMKSALSLAFSEQLNIPVHSTSISSKKAVTPEAFATELTDIINLRIARFSSETEGKRTIEFQQLAYDSKNRVLDFLEIEQDKILQLYSTIRHTVSANLAKPNAISAQEIVTTIDTICIAAAHQTDLYLFLGSTQEALVNALKGVVGPVLFRD